MFCSHQILMFVSDVTTNIAKQERIFIGKTQPNNHQLNLCVFTCLVMFIYLTKFIYVYIQYIIVYIYIYLIIYTVYIHIYIYLHPMDPNAFSDDTWPPKSYPNHCLKRYFSSIRICDMSVFSLLMSSCCRPIRNREEVPNASTESLRYS